jgi:hypothetical protein
MVRAHGLPREREGFREGVSQRTAGPMATEKASAISPAVKKKLPVYPVDLKTPRPTVWRRMPLPLPAIAMGLYSAR